MSIQLVGITYCCWCSSVVWCRRGLIRRPVFVGRPHPLKFRRRDLQLRSHPRILSQPTLDFWDKHAPDCTVKIIP